MTSATPRHPQAVARLALASLDLTSLNDGDTDADIVRLCERAHGVHGSVAAVCVWPRFAALARQHASASVAVAAVANFPAGGDDIAAAVREARAIVDAGAQEVDVVLPYKRLQQGHEASVAALLRAVRGACDGLRLKVILESGALDDALITRASQLSLDAGADFLKTSTGKIPAGASPHASGLMLDAIAANPVASSRAGFKASGGIRTVADAAAYFDLVEQKLGANALVPARLRIGASSLLNDIEAVLGGAAPSSTRPDGY
jgi:deoxyribose-phosphate aldolase